MVLDAREQHPHGVGAVVQVGDPRAVQVAGQLVDVRLQLCKSCSGGEESSGRGELSPGRFREEVLGRAGCPGGMAGGASSGRDSEELRHPWRLLSAVMGGERALLRAETENKAVVICMQFTPVHAHLKHL